MSSTRVLLGTLASAALLLAWVLRAQNAPQAVGAAEPVGADSRRDAAGLARPWGEAAAPRREATRFPDDEPIVLLRPAAVDADVSLRGWVVRDDRGVPGIRLSAWCTVGGRSVPLGEPVTDGEGDFELAVDVERLALAPGEPEPKFHVALDVPGFAWAVQSVGGLPPRQTYAFWLDPAGRLEGTVVDARGWPVPGARVELRWGTEDDEYGDEVTADGEGRFRFNVPDEEGTAHVLRGRCASAGRGELELGPCSTATDLRGALLRLAPWHVIEGTLVGHDGRPLAGQELSASPWTAEDPWSDEESVTRTDEDGRFRFLDLSAGRYTVLGIGRWVLETDRPPTVVRPPAVVVRDHSTSR